MIKITTQLTNNFQCGLYSDEVGDNNDSVQCDLCNKWDHTGCLYVGAEKCGKRNKDRLLWYCSNCPVETPFSALSNKGLKTCLFWRLF